MSGNRLRTSRRTVAIAVTAAAIAASGVVVAVAATPPPAHLGNTVGLKTVGPILESNGFPLWYKATSGQRLELCTDPGDALCIPGPLPTLGAPVVFPTNFPDEAFYSVGDSTLATNGSGGKALLVASVEAAFAGAGVPAAGQQVTFGRVRIRAAGVLDGQTYKVTHPFGVDTSWPMAPLGATSPARLAASTRPRTSAPWSAAARSRRSWPAVPPRSSSGTRSWAPSRSCPAAAPRTSATRRSRTR